MNRPAGRTLAILSLPFLVLAASAQTAQRPLTHADYDSWKSISAITLSRDGHYLAYGLFPQQGDGEVVLRDLKTGVERREPAGAQPPPPAPDPESEAPPRPPTISLAFSHDGKTVVFTTFPPKAETDAAKKAKKKPEDMPKGGLVILPTGGGPAVRVARVKSFQIPENADGWVAYQKEPAAGAAPAPASRRESAPADLVLREIGTGAEKTYPAVTEYVFTKDCKALYFAVSAAEKSGVFVVAPGAEPAALASGKGRYSKLLLDRKETRVAFLSDRDDTAGRPVKLAVYTADRSSATASVAVSGAPAGYRITESGTAPLLFSRDGSKLFYSLAVVQARASASAGDSNADEKATFDLWHYKDDFIQPIQKARVGADRARSYRAVFDFATRKSVQLADPSLAELIPSPDGSHAFGTDDRAYRSEIDYGEHYRDAYAVDTATGRRTLLSKRQFGIPSWSADGKFGIVFDGKDWVSVSAATGKITNLTAALPVKFFNEDTDTPNLPPAYGPAAWTTDGRALLTDRFDLWAIAPDGSGAANLTGGAGRKARTALRYVRLDREEEAVDVSKPLLLHAVNEDTRESGFSRLQNGRLSTLVMTANEYTLPVKAKDADVYALTGGSFSQFPDILVTDSGFGALKKSSDANPQKAGLLWGSSELVRYTNADGRELRAALYKPANFDPKKKYPMIVYIYERLSQSVNHFVDPRPTNSINLSFYASNGYLVLTPDIVYTTGYPGASALKCVLPAVQAVVDRGYVDESKIGIQGHSWGGYQIAYMITQTNRFRAAAPGAPVANMTSAYDGIRWGTGLPRQFQYEKTQSRIGGSLWEYPMRFIENSPLFQADRIHTPVLMIHNDADDAVPWYQGIEFYLALRRLGKEAYMFSYNGEPHNLRQRANQKDYTLRLQQYFDHYLKGVPAPDWMEKGIPYLEKVGSGSAAAGRPE
jgi:dipeptidyl aminopeptidase/acylaminoacyl peptidase